MMAGLLRRFRRDERGVAAMELALLAPVLVAIMMLGVEGWLHVDQTLSMQGALQSGGRYYQMGGADDAAAVTLARSTWTNRPTDGDVTVARVCKCGAVVVSCSSLCDNADTPVALVNLTATATFVGLTGSHPLRQTEIVRVR
jgi:Flp pilus assembly protein TadG